VAKIYGCEHYMYNSVRVFLSTFVDTSYITRVKDVMFNNVCVLTEGVSVKGASRDGNS